MDFQVEVGPEHDAGPGGAFSFQHDEVGALFLQVEGNGRLLVEICLATGQGDGLLQVRLDACQVHLRQPLQVAVHLVELKQIHLVDLQLRRGHIAG